ncbi:SusC/RagA family TonB-linked outer membrane protein [Pontibacter silvestris]|uniref:SusC/RagA family TonB-linked outer membrane protein n=1 Tax=Pontibacter silvestris TaxID=2305183 RepID=A0ABW4WX20_9BACT|nr:SusC/RagA family TonB-linked outer membrane protein [Pontibacter silvestris]MCC9136385.1 SusC/RagA family TonB-linked outer membrane protein [Pontibacter silvestris]
MRKLFTLLAMMLAICSINYAHAQSKVVSGRVTSSEDNAALPGVSIAVQGTSVGTTTDIDGNYRITLPSEANTLIFSFIGYTNQVVQVNSRSQINVSMVIDSKQLDEVVVTALGIERSERSLGYATQEVSGDNLTFTKEQNVVGSLAGKVAGVQVVGSSGASMGGTQKIKIRGVNSVAGGGEPLIVVDGTPISNANFSGSTGIDLGNLSQDINPEDVESVNVLKGPAASALYGIRGQFGVIMITTKKGRRGAEKVSVQLNSAFSVERVGNIMPYQNMYGGGSSQTWRTLPNGDKYVQMNVDESWGPLMDGTPVRQVFSFYPQDPTYGQLTPFVPHPDNIKDYYETGSTLNNGVSISGGSDRTNYRISLNDTRIQGVEPNTWLKRNNLGVSLGVDLAKKLTASANINYARNTAQRPAQGSEDGSRYLGQWFQRSLDMNRLKNYQYADGTFLHWNLRTPSSTTGEVTNFKPLYWNNPYFEAYENPSNDNRDRFFGDVGLTYQVLPELKLSGFVRSDMFTQNVESRTAFGGTNVPGYSVAKYQNKEFNYEFLAQYSKEWGNFSLNANLGANLYDRNYTYISQATAGGLSVPGYYNLAASIDRPTSGRELYPSYELNKQIRSGYGMVSLGYKDTYFVDASFRRDHSSTLADPYWYPSVSGSFVFSELLPVSPLSYGKLRVSYAEAGSDVDVYATSVNYGIGGIYDGVNTITVPDNLANPLIRPAFARSYEAGIDLKFFQDRFGVDFTYYQQRNKDEVFKLAVSGASGYESTVINAGLIENKGIELTLTGTPVQSQLFTWNAVFNLNRNRSKIIELAPDIDALLLGSTTYSSTSSYLYSYVGEKFGSLVGQAYQRDEETGKMLLDANGLPLYTTATHNFGSVLPDYTGGFQNTFRIWKIDAAAMIDFQVGGKFFSRSKMLAVRTGLDPITVATNDKGHNVRDAVSEGGGVRVDGIYGPDVTINGENVGGQEVTLYVDPQTYYGTTARRIYEDWLYDASYVKLREVRLGYTLDKSILGNLPVQGVNIALIARNPAMIWQKAPKGLDPSELSTGSQSISWYESGQLSTVRSYGVNLNITF